MKERGWKSKKKEGTLRGGQIELVLLPSTRQRNNTNEDKREKEKERDLILQKTHDASYARKIADRSFEDKHTRERIG